MTSIKRLLEEARHWVRIHKMIDVGSAMKRSACYDRRLHHFEREGMMRR